MHGTYNIEVVNTWLDWRRSTVLVSLTAVCMLFSCLVQTDGRPCLVCLWLISRDGDDDDGDVLMVMVIVMMCMMYMMCLSVLSLFPTSSCQPSAHLTL